MAVTTIDKVVRVLLLSGRPFVTRIEARALSYFTSVTEVARVESPSEFASKPLHTDPLAPQRLKPKVAGALSARIGRRSRGTD